MKPSLRILFAVHGYKPAYRVGGPILSVAALAEGLVKKGHSVTVFTTNCNLTEDMDVVTDKPVDVDGVEVWYFKRKEPFQKYLPFIPYLAKSMGFLYAPQMRTALERIVPTVDVVHTHLPFMYPTYAAGRAAIRYGKPLFYHQRGVFDPDRLRFRAWKKRLYIKFVEKPLIKQANTLICLTEAEIASYRALGVNTRCEVIPNGIDVEKYWQVTPEEWHDRLGISRNSKVVLFLGRLHPIKGTDRLIRAFLNIRDKFPRAVLVCAGPDEFKLQEKFKSMIGGKNSEGGRILFPGMVSGDQKKALLSRADIFCLPSDAEGLSMAVLEAMASKTAVLLSPGCHFDAVETVGAGKIVPKDSESVGAALSDLLSDNDRLKKMGTAGFELVKREYGWDNIVQKLLFVYERGIQERKTL
jgi:glycosyltransferase involved in cell wall biosynthesis